MGTKRSTRKSEKNGDRVTSRVAPRSQGERPYSDELVEKICWLLAEGKTVSVVCKDPAVNISRWTFYRWCEEKPEFDEAVAKAKLIGSEAIMDEIRETASTEKETVEVTESETVEDGGGERSDVTGGKTGKKYRTVKRGDGVASRKLKIYALFEILKRSFPEKYGDLQKVEHSGTVDLGAAISEALGRVGGRGDR